MIKLRMPGRQYLTLMIILAGAILSILIIIWLNLLRDGQDRLNEIEKTLLLIAHKTSDSHLWLEEYVTKDTTIISKNVFDGLNSSLSRIDKLLDDSMKLSDLSIRTMDAHKMITQFETTKTLLEEIKSVALERYSYPESSGIGTEIDQYYDRVYKDFLGILSILIDGISSEVINNQTHIQRLEFDVLLLWSLVVGVGVIGFWTREVRRYRMAKALKKISSSLQTSIDHMPVAYIMLGTDFRIQKWNPAAEKIFGFSNEGATGQDIFNLIVPKDIKDIVKDTVRPLLNGVPASYSELNNNIRKDGKIISCHWFNTPIKDITGKVNAIQCMAMDITKHKQVEKLLEESEERLQMAVKVGQIGMFDWDIINDNIHHDPELNKLYGLKSDNTIDSKADFLNLIHPDDVGKLDQKIKQAVKMGSSYACEYRIIRPDGRLCWMTERAETYRNEFSEVYRMVGVVQNITERKNAERVLIELREKYEDLYNNSPDMYVSVDAASAKILQNNNTLAFKLGYENDELIGQPIFDMYHSDCMDDVKNTFHSFAATGEVNNAELQLKRKDGTKIDVILNASAVRDEAGNILHSRSALRDITNLKQTENELKVSHEILKQIASIQSEFISESTRGEIFEELLDDILKMSESQFGFIGEIRKDSDGKSYLILYGISNIACDRESKFFFEENYEKDMKFSNLDSLYGEVMKTGKTVISNNPSEDPRSVGVPEGHPVLDSYIGIPLYVGDRLVGMVSLANRPGGYESEIVDYLDPFIKTSANIVRSYKLYRHRIEAEESLKNSRDQLRQLARKLENVREQERTEIARDIHDDLGQSLTALKLDVSAIKKKTRSKDFISRLDSMSELIDSTIKIVQKVATRLRPGILDDLGLLSAMEWQLEEFQTRTRIKCKFKHDDIDMTHDDERSTTLFRIFQELLTNVAQHAKASKVKVQLSDKDNTITLKVRDNGIGIRKEDKTNPKSYGLLGISERLIPWDGKIKITGTKKGGTVVTVIIPVINGNNK